MGCFKKKFLSISKLKKARVDCSFSRALFMVLFLLSAASPVVRLATIRYSQLHAPRGKPGTESLDTFTAHFLSLTEHLDAHEVEPDSSSSMQINYCSSLINGSKLLGSTEEGTLCCDRSSWRSDVCYLKGDIRTSSSSSSIILYNAHQQQTEKVRPYTRKWEAELMKTINEVHIKAINARRRSFHQHPIIKCDVNHSVPAVVFSTGGYTGNLYHEFNDGLIPLYITAERFKGEVVLVVLEFHQWWMSKYREVVKRMTKYELVDFDADHRVHCFKEMIVGLRIHGELTIDHPSHGGTGRTIQDFHNLLHECFKGSSAIQRNQTSPRPALKNNLPVLLILVRSKSRVVLNLKETIKSCQQVGFQVQTLKPKRTTPLSEIYAALNYAHVVVGVHGAALTHFLFMRPGSVFIQIVPLGLTWPAETYYGEPAMKLGLKYFEYRIAAEESSLWEEYKHDDAIISDPDAVNKKGWAETKRIYLEKQNVRLNQVTFLKVLEKAYLCFNQTGLKDP